MSNINWLKDYLTADILTLLVTIATLIVACLSYQYTRKRDKRQREQLLKRKRAQLAAMKSSMRVGFNVSEIGALSGNIAALEADIEQLECNE